jgi:hypothetical protein
MLTPMMVGVTVTSIVAGQVTTRTGRYKLFPILGGAIMVLAMYLLTGLAWHHADHVGIHYVSSASAWAS